MYIIFLTTYILDVGGIVHINTGLHIIGIFLLQPPEFSQREISRQRNKGGEVLKILVRVRSRKL